MEMAAGRARLGRVFLVGGVCAIIPELLKLLVDSLEFGPWVSAAATIAGGGLVELMDGLKEKKPPSPPARGRPPVAAMPSGVPIVVAVVVLALLAGAAYGGTILWRYVSGTESGVERMAQPPAKGLAGPLTATVRGVEVTPNFIKLKIAATNKSANPITMVINEEWCKLIEPDGTSLPVYGGISGLGSGNIEVPGGSVPVTDVLTFKGQPSGTSLVLSISHLGGTTVVQSLQIKNIKLTP